MFIVEFPVVVVLVVFDGRFVVLPRIFSRNTAYDRVSYQLLVNVYCTCKV